MAGLLRVEGLKTSFHTRNGVAHAVDGVSFEVAEGETIGIVGESGSGKSVTAYSLLGLIPQPPGRIEGGKAMFRARSGEVDLLNCSPAELRSIRGRQIAMVFQDSMTSLNPFLRIEDQLIEPLLIHERLKRREAVRRGIEALEEVGVADAARRIRSYPHEFSGGMRQRVMIAMALITKPQLLIADEPTTALDVTVQAQILEVIKKMQRELGTAVILVSHDLGVVAGLCQRVLVMYAGRIVESGPIVKLYGEPKHPYNRALQKSIPGLQAKGAELYTIPGHPPDVTRPVEGCAFAPRCEFVADRCRHQPIELREVSRGHSSACVRVQAEEISLK